MKRERERAWFLQLSPAYEIDEITRALRFVREHGVPGSGEQCHSPMAFLARGMSEVLAETQRVALTNAKMVENKRQREAAEVEDREETHRQQEEWQRKELAFLAEFPTRERQESAVKEWAEQLPWKPSNPQAIKSLAICSWWEAAQTTGSGTG
ncbi:hypothetical protein WDW37_20435 [Bdellovibrionota bacterium FG-1]